MTEDVARRTAYIASLRAFADFLEQHPAVDHQHDDTEARVLAQLIAHDIRNLVDYSKGQD